MTTLSFQKGTYIEKSTDFDYFYSSRHELKAMRIGENIKKLRESRGIKQQEIADLIGMHRSNYSKIESGQRELSVIALGRVASFFGVSTDDLIYGTELPEHISVADKSTMEKVRLMEGLDPEDRTVVFKMIDALLTNKKFKDFFKENMDAA